MCGIAGIIAYGEDAPPVDRSELVAMRESMAARGPDGSGLWASDDGRAALAHRRLAIIDLTEAGAQPMASADGRLHITFNGEIYNYRELRTALAADGAVFRSNSDTEVLLALYARRGAAMVHALRGMFAFAIWDEREKTLFLARDPFGIKPLYFADDGRTLRFASQVKALMAPGRLSREPDPAGHVGFFVLGSVPEPFTMYRSVQALGAGTTLTLRRGAAATTERYFDIAKETIEAGQGRDVLTGRDRDEFLVETLRDSVRSHMVADVPVGLFLSSGLDSSIVAGLATQVHGAKLHSVTLGFEEYRGTHNDETPLAAQTARHLGTEHHTRWITREAFEESFDRLLGAMDQPSIDGANTYFVSMAAAEDGMKVALSGLGGDELFGGYPSFRDVPRIARWLRFAKAAPSLARWTRRAAGPFVSALASPKYAGLLEYGGDYAGGYLLRRALYMPWEVPAFLEPPFFREGWERLDALRSLGTTVEGIEHPRQRVAALELSWYLRNQLLRDADWAGMAHSVEIRVPFVDREVFRAVVPLMAEADPPGKRDVARIMSGRLPGGLLERPKTGFSIPVHEWATRSSLLHRRTPHLRSWSHIVYRPYRRLRYLVLLSDAFGSSGGIAKFNRDLLASLCAMPECERVVAIPRLMPSQPGVLPAELAYVEPAAGGKIRFVCQSLKFGARERFDAVIAGHINLLPIASLIARLRGKPVALIIHGIDAWQPRRSTLANVTAHRADAVISVSRLTLDRFSRWAKPAGRAFILPNSVDLRHFAPGPAASDLVQRIGGSPVLVTLGRMSERERYKGFDEVIEVLPRLVRRYPSIRYVACGDGADRARLEDKVKSMGLEAYVIFPGFVAEERKADFYRAADAYVMPSRGEGFGIVYLEAAACGIPVIGSKVDGSREALLDGRIGSLVDPANPDEIEAAIEKALASPKAVPAELGVYSFERFAQRAAAIARDIVCDDPFTARHTPAEMAASLPGTVGASRVQAHRSDSLA